MSMNPPTPSTQLPIILAISAMTVIAIMGIVLVTIFRPDADNTSIITSLLTIVVPTTAALLAYLKSAQNETAVHELHISTNSKMDQLVATTDRAAHAEGVIEGVAQAQVQNTELVR